MHLKAAALRGAGIPMLAVVIAHYVRREMCFVRKLIMLISAALVAPDLGIVSGRVDDMRLDVV